MEPTPSGRLGHDYRLNLGGCQPRLHSNMSSSYKQLLSYPSYGRQGHLPKNMSDVPKCTCDIHSHQGNLTLAVIKITLVILGLWATSAGLPLYKGVYRSLIKGRSTCDVYMLVSGSFEFFIKLGTLPRHRLDYVFSATEELRITNASGLFSCKVTHNVTDSSSGTMKNFGCKLRSDPGVTQYQIIYSRDWKEMVS